MGVYNEYLDTPQYEDTSYNTLPTESQEELQQALADLKASRLNARGQDKANRFQGVDYSKDQAATLQQGLSDVMDQQVYTMIGPDGLPFKYQIDPTTGNKIPYNGETRNLYIAQGRDGSYKLGLARNDLTDRAKELGMTPFKARYSDKSDMFGLGYNSPYINGGGDYDGTPGDSGVDPAQDPFLDVELPYDIATKYEKQVHTSSGMIKNRAIGQGAVDGNDIINYGAGKTEYSTADAPLWNLNYDEDGAPIEAGTPVAGRTRLGNNQREDTFEALDALQAGTVTLGGKTAALAGEAYNNIANEFRDKPLTSDNALEAWGKKLQEDANKIAGYNPKALEEGTVDIQNGYRQFSQGNYGSGLINMIKGGSKAGPQVVAGSLPELGAIAAAGAVSGGTGLFAAIGTVGAGNANQVLDEREKLNDGRKATAEEVIGVLAAETLATALDYGSFKFITGGKSLGVLFKGEPKPRKLNDLVAEMSDTGDLTGIKTELVKALGRGAARSAASGGTEFIQEGTTEAIRTLATEIGTDKFKDEDWVETLNRNGIDILTSATLGAAGGVGFGIPKDGAATAKDIAGTLNKVNEEVTRNKAARGLETQDEALDARTTRTVEADIAKDTLTTAHGAQASLDEAATVDELYRIVDTLAASDTASGREYIKIQAKLDSMQGLEDPNLDNIKQEIFNQSEKSIDNIVRTGKGLNRDIESLNKAVDEGTLPEAIETETGETTFKDAEGNTQYKYTGEELTKEIAKTTEAIKEHEDVISSIASKYAKENGISIDEAKKAVNTDPDVAQSNRMIDDLSAKHQKLLEQQATEEAKATIDELKDDQMAQESDKDLEVDSESPEDLKAADAQPEATEEVKPKKVYSSKSSARDLREIALDTINEGLPKGTKIAYGDDLNKARSYLKRKLALKVERAKIANRKLQTAKPEEVAKLRDEIAKLGEEHKAIKAAMGNLEKRYKEARKYRSVANSLIKNKKKTVGELEADTLAKLEKGLKPDEKTKKKVKEQVNGTIAAASRVAPKPTRLVKSLLKKFDTGEGTASDAKAKFETRIQNLSSKAIEQLLETENLDSLVEAYKDNEGNIALTKPYFKKSLEAVLRKRDKSRQYFSNKVVTETPSGKGGKAIADAQAGIQQSVETGDAEAFRAKIDELLTAINNSSLFTKSQLLKKGEIDKLGTDEGTIQLYLEALQDGSETKNAILENIRLTQVLVKNQIADDKSIKKLVLRVSKADTASFEDIEFAKEALKDLHKNGQIDNKQRVLLSKLLEKVLDRSTIIARERAVQAKEEEATITKARDEEIDSDTTLTAKQKEAYKKMPASIYYQLFNKSDSDATIIKEAMNEVLSNEDIKPEELYVDDCK